MTGCRTALLLTCFAFPAATLSQTATTVVTIGPTLHSGVKHLGINLSGQNFYDSGQMLRNLVFRNPGFEGETWQSIVQCKSVASLSCTTADQYAVWPANFLANASFEILSGSSRGRIGTIVANTAIGAAGPNTGPTLSFSPGSAQPGVGDFLVLRMTIPGHAEAGWWTNPNGGTISTELQDLPPATAGKQAIRIDSSGAGQNPQLHSYFDSFATHSFVQLHGTYHLSFRAKQLGGTQGLAVTFQRLDASHGQHVFLSKTVPLNSTWQDLSFDFPTDEPASALGTLDLTFSVNNASVLLDDVFLGQAAPAPGNPTAFRDEVVQTLRDLKPGVLRYMDSGTDFGSSIDNMIAPPFGRQRAGSSTQQTLQEDIPLGLHEFLVLCQAVGAEPWYSMPPGISVAETQSLIEYMAGGPNTPYGARRAALGQSTPWTSVFPSIHLELGNEEWNYGTFAGSTINDPVAYGSHAGQIFTAARASAAYNADVFDLVLGSWNNVPWYTQQELKSSLAYDTVAVAPYLYSNFSDSSSAEAIFGPMLAQPEAFDSRSTGYVMQQAAAARNATRPAKLAIYETNLSTAAGSAPQSAIDSTVPSLGAGLAAVEHMLLTLRDDGVNNQCLFALPGYENKFLNPSGAHETTPLWGAVVDMGGSSNRRRPVFLAEQLANQAILPTMLRTTLTGANPTWNQPLSTNDNIQISGAHLIQSFAFVSGTRHSVILFNLSRTQTLQVSFAGAGSPSGSVTKSVLTSRNITDNNEGEAGVTVTSSTLAPSTSLPLALAPFSMTTLTWTAP